MIAFLKTYAFKVRIDKYEKVVIECLVIFEHFLFICSFHLMMNMFTLCFAKSNVRESDLKKNENNNSLTPCYENNLRKNTSEEQISRNSVIYFLIKE